MQLGLIGSLHGELASEWSNFYLYSVHECM